MLIGIEYSSHTARVYRQNAARATITSKHRGKLHAPNRSSNVR
jgi:hypothetical protein